MKLIIQIPCYNEAKTLPLVFESLPRSIKGIDKIEYQVIDDGSTDETVKVARELGAHHVISLAGRNRRWLGRAFRYGIDHALKEGADIVVNTDGDNQYPSTQIPELVKPILDGKAQIVIGDRGPASWKEFSLFKRFLQKLGNLTLSLLIGEKVVDAVSGFRAYSRGALLKLHIVTNFTYTVDTLMQAYKKGIDISWIKIVPNFKTRESRLITSLLSKVRKSGTTILRLTTVYEPFKTFLWLSLLFFIPGIFFLVRFAYIFFFVVEGASGHVQSVVFGGVCLGIGVQMLVLGILGELMAVNRTLIEDLLTRMRKLEANSDKQSSFKQSSLETADQESERNLLRSVND